MVCISTFSCRVGSGCGRGVFTFLFPVEWGEGVNGGVSTFPCSKVHQLSNSLVTVNVSLSLSLCVCVCVSVCVRVCVRTRVRACVYVCVRERVYE